MKTNQIREEAEEISSFLKGFGDKFKKGVDSESGEDIEEKESENDSLPKSKDHADGCRENGRQYRSDS